MKNVPLLRVLKLLLVLAPTACDTTGMTYYGYSYGYGAPVGYPGAWGGGYYGPGWYGPGYGGYGGYGGVVVVSSGPPIPY